MSRKRKNNGVPDEAAANGLRSALSGLSFIEVLNHGAALDRVRLLMRVHDDSSWLPVLKLILREEKRQQEAERAWSVHICRQFMLRPDNDEVLGFAWNFILRGTDLRAAVSDISRVIDLAKSAITLEDTPRSSARGVVPKRQFKTTAKQRQKIQGDIWEYPLMASPDRNMPEGNLFEPGKKQKGAHLIGGN